MSCVSEREEARLDRPSMTGGGAAFKARGCPPIFCENRFPPRPLRSAALRSAALTAAPPPVPRTLFSMMGISALEIIMSMYQSIETALDRVMAALVAGLELEFGRGAGEALAHRFLEAEEADFCWGARVEERWIGAYESTDGGRTGPDSDLRAARWKMVLRHHARGWRWSCPGHDGMPRVRGAGSGAGCDGSCALNATERIRRGGVGSASSLPFF